MIDPDQAEDEIYRLSSHANGHVKLTYPAAAFEARETADRWDIDGAMAEAAEAAGTDYATFSEAVHAVAFPERDDASLTEALLCCHEVAGEGLVSLSAGDFDMDRFVELASRRKKKRRRRTGQRYDDGSFGNGGADGEGGDGGPSGDGGGAGMSMSAPTGSDADGEIDRLHKLSLEIHKKAFGSGRKAPRSSGKHSPSNPRQVGTASRAHAPDEEDLDPEVKRLRAELERLVHGRGHIYDNAVSAEHPHGSHHSHPPHHGYPGTGRSGKPQNVHPQTGHDMGACPYCD